MTPTATAIATPSSRERPHAGADDVRPAADADAQRDREHLRRRDHERRGARPQAVLVVQEEHAEPDHRHLRVEVERRCRGTSRQSRAVAERRARRSPARPASASASLPAAEHEPRRQPHRPHRAPPGRGTPPRTRRPLRAAGSDERRDEAADRNRGLPDRRARGPAARAPNQCITARPLAEFTLAPGRAREREQDEQRGEARPRTPRPRGSSAQPPRPIASTARSPRRSAAIPHGSSVSERADPAGGEQQPDLAERERRTRPAAWARAPAGRCRAPSSSPAPQCPAARTAHR